MGFGGDRGGTGLGILRWGGGGGGGGLAIALSLPFVLGLLYSGFRRLRTSGSVPSAPILKEPERPG